MFWNKKDDKGGLPDLPPLKTPLRPSFDLPRRNDLLNTDTSAETEEIHKLPSFPDSPMQNSFSQMSIKEAITKPINEEYAQKQTMDSSIIKTVEMDSPSIKNTMQRPFSLESPPEEDQYVPSRKPMQKTNEIFVKLERFNSAHRSIMGIRKKIDDIDSALKRIREVKMREEQELTLWEKEISALKSRLQEVNDILFD